MRTIISLALAITLWSSLLVIAPATAQAGDDTPPKVECNGNTQTEINEFHGQIEYAITYDRNEKQICVVAKSTGERKGFFGYSVWIDGSRTFASDTEDLKPGETFKRKHTIKQGIDATRDNHTVQVHAYNVSFYFNFTQEVDTMNERGIPTPHFENLTVKRNGTKSGQPRLVLVVENEGLRTYVPEAEVRTFESDSRRLLDYVNESPGGRYSVRLSEDNEDVIVGTVRLYGGKFNPGTKFDRVSFVSYPNGTYRTWEPEFGEIPTDREIEEREIYYKNESARKMYMGPDVDPVSERASKMGAVIVVALAVFGLWYRLR